MTDTTDPHRPSRLDQIDGDLQALEGAVERLLEQQKHLLYELGGLVIDHYGRDSEHLARLYPETDVAGRKARTTPWHRPSRRWRQYGSKAALVALCKKHGIKPGNHTREY
ncbi:MAG TPA: hypothetical protein VIK61_07410, partial [Acidimicrobiia bacterium]